MQRHMTVLGGGSWGTALACQLARMGHPTLLWDRNAERCGHINAHHTNPDYLKGVTLPVTLHATHQLDEALDGASLVVPVVPSHALRDVLERGLAHIADNAEVCCATKGIEAGSLKTMTEVVKDVLPERYHFGVTVLSGPSFALEVARDLPTTVVIGGPEGAAHRAAEAFHGGNFRVYDTRDAIGVSVGGSLKNVMAIGCGISDGLGLGANARAALITRGLAEITRLAVRMGAQPLTMMGLAGMGDLVLTCTGSLSRNRRVGLALGEGRTLAQILDELGEVAEGVTTAKTARLLGRSLGVELPLTEAVYQIVHQGLAASDALGHLLGRARKGE